MNALECVAYELDELEELACICCKEDEERFDRIKDHITALRAEVGRLKGLLRSRAVCRACSGTGHENIIGHEVCGRCHGKKYPAEVMAALENTNPQPKETK